MKLDFFLLIVDDNPNSLNQAILALKEYLETKGFTLNQVLCENFSEKNLREVAMKKGRNFDLVIVDYDLDAKATDGAKVAQKLRTNLPYTDIVFYSSDPAVNLLGELAKLEVEGVFAKSRNALDDALKGISDTIIGKAVDLNHMRGIAMAEVAEMDVVMTGTLIQVFNSTDKRVSDLIERTAKRLIERTEGIQPQLTTKLEQSGILSVIEDISLFSSSDRYQTVRRIAKTLRTKPEAELKKLNSYDEIIIGKRNMLAHAKEDTGNSGEVILHTAKQDQENTVIDDGWMQNFRRELKEYRQALDSVCDAIKTEFARPSKPRNPQQG